MVVCGRNAPEALPEADGRQAEFIPADVRDVDSLAALFAAIERALRPPRRAGQQRRRRPFALADEASPRFHESIIRLNLIAPLNVAQQANRLMQHQARAG